MSKFYVTIGGSIERALEDHKHATFEMSEAEYGEYLRHLEEAEEWSAFAKRMMTELWEVDKAAALAEAAPLPSFKTPVCACLACGQKIDVATMASSDSSHQPGPGPGDVTVCLECGHVMSFNEDMTVRELSEQEMLDVVGHPTLLAVQRARVETMKKKGASS